MGEVETVGLPWNKRFVLENGRRQLCELVKQYTYTYCFCTWCQAVSKMDLCWERARTNLETMRTNWNPQVQHCPLTTCSVNTSDIGNLQ